MGVYMTRNKVHFVKSVSIKSMRAAYDAPLHVLWICLTVSQDIQSVFFPWAESLLQCPQSPSKCKKKKKN